MQCSAPHISYTVLSSPSWLALSSFWTRLFSCLPSDCLTSIHAPFNPAQHDSLQIKLCHTSFFLTLQFRIKPTCYHGMWDPLQSALLESSPTSLPPNDIMNFYSWNLPLIPCCQFVICSLSCCWQAQRGACLCYLQWSWCILIVSHPLTRVKVHQEQETDGFVFIFPVFSTECPVYVRWIKVLNQHDFIQLLLWAQWVLGSVIHEKNVK